jgi:hypothetical protein
LRHVQRNFATREIYPVPGLDTERAGVQRPVPYVLSLPPERLDEIRVYMAHLPYIVAELLPVDSCTITVLRDPVDRTISHLKHVKRLQPPFRDLPLEQIYDDRMLFRFFLDNHQAKVFSMTRDDRLMGIMDPIDVDDRRLALAKSNLDNVDVIGLFDRYDEFLGDLHTRFGWVLAPLESEHVSTEAWGVSPSFRRRIEADMAKDIEFYEYARTVHAHRRST